MPELHTSRRTFLQVSAAGILAPAATLLQPGRPAQAAQSSDVVYASDYGYDPADATDALQSALDSDARTVIIDDVGAQWLTRPLAVKRDHVCIVVEPGVVVRAKPGAYPDRGDRILTINGRSDVTLIGYGAHFAMNKQEYIDMDPAGQWRHALNIQSSQNIRVEGLTLSGAGGDGIYIGSLGQPDLLNYCENVVLKNVTCDNNYRNGLSVISVNKLLVEGCSFINTSGHNPRAGIDIEPNYAGEQITGVTIRDCIMDNNEHTNLQFSLQHPAYYAAPLDVLVDRVYLGRQSSAYPLTFTYYGPSGTDPGGMIEVRDSLIESDPASCSIAISGKQADGATLRFNRVTAINWGNEAGHYPPMYLTGLSSVSEFGGIVWDDFTMLVDQPVAFLRANAPVGSPVIRDLTGTMTVVDPHGVYTDLGRNTAEIDLDIRALTAIPPATVRVTTPRPRVHRGAPVTLMFSRDTPDVRAPLAIHYSVSGTAVDGLAVDNSSGVAVIPPGARSVRASIGTRRLAPASAGAQQLTVSIESSIAYAIGAPSGVTIAVDD